LFAQGAGAMVHDRSLEPAGLRIREGQCSVLVSHTSRDPGSFDDRVISLARFENGETTIQATAVARERRNLRGAGSLSR
jgi:hypothetical protein